MSKHSHNYKGGSITEHGYKIIFVGKSHHLADCRGYAYEQRVVAEQKIERRLKARERVHHIDGNRENNLPENIEVCKSMFHHLYKHRKKISNKRKPDETNPIVKCKCGCGVEFGKYDQSNRPREFVSGHNSYKRR